MKIIFRGEKNNTMRVVMNPGVFSDYKAEDLTMRMRKWLIKTIADFDEIEFAR